MLSQVTFHGNSFLIKTTYDLNMCVSLLKSIFVVLKAVIRSELLNILVLSENNGNTSQKVLWHLDMGEYELLTRFIQRPPCLEAAVIHCEAKLVELGSSNFN